MPFDQLIFFYTVSFLAALVALALHSAMRLKRFEPTASEDRVFRCDRCHYVYTDDPDVDFSRCPRCGLQNHRCKF